MVSHTYVNIFVGLYFQRSSYNDAKIVCKWGQAFTSSVI